MFKRTSPEPVKVMIGWRLQLLVELVPRSRIALRFVQAGENVIIGPKAVEKAQEAVGKIKELLENYETSNLKAAANADAAKEAEILALTVRLTAQKSNSLVYQGRSSRENIDGCFWAT